MPFLLLWHPKLAGGPTVVEAAFSIAAEGAFNHAGAARAHADLAVDAVAQFQPTGTALVRADLMVEAVALWAPVGAARAEAAFFTDGAVASFEPVGTAAGTIVEADLSIDGAGFAEFSGTGVVASDLAVVGVAALVVDAEAEAGADDETYRPAWLHGTSRAKLKNPWGKKKKPLEIANDDEEVFELVRLAIARIERAEARRYAAAA